MTKVRHPVVVLVKASGIPAYIAQMKAVVAAIAADKDRFTKPIPALSQVSAHIQSLEDWQTEVLNKTPGAVGSRDAAEGVLDFDKQALVAYVQSLVNADPEHAEEIAAAAGMAIRGAGTKSLSDLVVHPGKLAGTVDAEAHNMPKTTHAVIHEWRWTPDGGKTVVNARSTAVAHTTITGLPSLSQVGFQHRVCWDGYDGEWSATVTILVP